MLLDLVTGQCNLMTIHICYYSLVPTRILESEILGFFFFSVEITNKHFLSYNHRGESEFKPNSQNVLYIKTQKMLI